MDRFGLSSPPPDLRPWEDLVSRLRAPEWTVRIAVVGKYVKMKDAYKSLVEALTHGGAASNVGVEIDWVEGEDVEDGEALRSRLSAADGVLVPGGFGSRGVEGKIAAIGYARRRGIPFLGICLGMQLAVVEAARSAGLEGASSTEFGPTPHPVVAKMVEWEKDGISVRRDSGDLGGTMRLGAYPAVLEPDSLSASLYGSDRISERHRHRYEVGSAYEGILADDGLRVVGWSPDKTLPEVVERPDHPWFVAVQFHPEFKSRPLDPHPLFKGFVAAALRRSRLV